MIYFNLQVHKPLNPLKMWKRNLVGRVLLLIINQIRLYSTVNCESTCRIVVGLASRCVHGMMMAFLLASISVIGAYLACTRYTKQYPQCRSFTDEVHRFPRHRLRTAG